MQPKRRKQKGGGKAAPNLGRHVGFNKKQYLDQGKGLAAKLDQSHSVLSAETRTRGSSFDTPICIDFKVAPVTDAIGGTFLFHFDVLCTYALLHIHNAMRYKFSHHRRNRTGGYMQGTTESC